MDSFSNPSCPALLKIIWFEFYNWYRYNDRPIWMLKWQNNTKSMPHRTAASFTGNIKMCGTSDSLISIGVLLFLLDSRCPDTEMQYLCVIPMLFRDFQFNRFTSKALNSAQSLWQVLKLILVGWRSQPMRYHWESVSQSQRGFEVSVWKPV